MYCTKCGAENADTSKFCKSCGNALQQAYSQEQDDRQAYQQDHRQPEPPVQKPKKKKKGCLIGILIVLAILLVLIIAAALNGGEVDFSTAHFQDAVMASEIDLSTSEPLVKTDVFSQTANVIYVTAYVKNVPPDTKASSFWTYIPSGETLAGDPVYLDQDAQIQFNVTMPNGFIPGEYQVDLLINDEIKETLSFTVE